MKSFIKSLLEDEVSITLDQLLKQYANEKSRGIYFTQYDGSELFESYEKLYFNAKCILGALQKQGFKQGSHIIFQTNNNLFFIRLFWGCILGGMIPVPLSVPLLASPDTEAFKKLVKVSKQLSDAWIISDKENLDIVREHYEANNLKYLEYETLASNLEEGQCVTVDCEDVAYIQYSSGSTGNPKGVKLTHKNLAYNLSQISERMKLQKNDIMASWLPLTHDMGLIGYHLTPIFVGVSQFLLNSVMFLKKSWLYFQKCTQLKATVLASPNFGLDWMMNTMKGSRLNNIDLSSVRNIMCGAEPISMDTIRRFYAKFSPYGLRENTIHQVYGMAEACVAVTIPTEGHNRSVCINRHKARTGQEVEYVETKEPNAAEFAIVGQPLDGLELMIVDDEDHILGENYIGNIVIKGKNVFGGYMNQDSSPFNEQGFFYTGDLGFIRNGELIVMGRKKDILFVNGQNYYASDIENMLTLAIPQLSQVVVCYSRSQSSNKDEIIVFVHDRHDVKTFLPLAHQVQNMVLERVGIAADYVIPIKTIPKTTSGKVQRYRLMEQFENHEFDEVMAIAPYSYQSIEKSTKKSPWNKTEIENQILEIAKDVFSITSLKVDDAISQMGVSSLTLIRFQDEINQRFQVEIPIVSLLKMSTLEQIIMFVEEQLKIEDVNTSELTGNKDMWYEPFPVTEIQGAYLVGRQNIMEMGNVSTHAYYEIETALDIKRLNDALNHVLEHQLMLRTIFDETGFQKVRRSISSYNICIEDLQDLSSDEQQKRILEKRNHRSHFVFQQDHWPLFELSAFILGEKRNYLFLDIDLLIADGGSLLIFIQEIMNYYEKPDMEMKPLEFQFSDYVRALESFRETSAYQRAGDYWQAKIENFAYAPQLPFVREPETIEKPIFQRLEKSLTADKWNIVKSLATQHGVTPSVFLCTIYAEILCKWSNQSRMALNLTLFNRQSFHPDVMKLIGDFTSVLLLDIDLSVHRAFWERASMVQDILFEAVDHRFYSGVDVIRNIASKREMTSKAIMPIVFTSMLFDKLEFTDSMTKWGKIKYGISQTPQVFLDFQVTERDGQLLLTWDYVKDLFDEDMINAMFETYQLRLQQVIENNSASVPLPLKQSELLLDYNHTQGDYEGDLLQKLIDQQCQKTPDVIAVKLGQDTLTYGELARKSNQIARYLAEQNYPHNSYIGVWAERRIETIVNTVAILKAGHAYIPVNPEHPQERIEYIVEHSDIKLMLHPDLYEKENLSSYNDGTLESLENCRQNKAYAIYTSGSTGHPKGVVITHEAVVNTLLDINEKFKVGREDKIIALSSMCFDLSVYDIFGALISGAQLVLIPDLLDMDSIHQIMLEEEITIWNSVPAIMDMYMESTNQDTVQRAFTESLRVVMLSGDWIPLGLPEKIKTRMPKAQVISLGGATEGSIWSIYFPIKEMKPEWKSIPYGYPLKNQQIYVLDEFGEECPVGVPGELHIGGKGVAVGYLGEEEKTKAAFIKHRLGYLYKTGDYGVMRLEGYIEFLGRRDSQVKIRGHRIELGEIEHCINHLPKIRQSVVADYCDQQGEKHLCGYIVADETVELTEIQRELAKYLPDYMVPAQLVQVDEIPLSANGKVDRKLLPDPEKYFEESKMTRGYEAPKTQTEKLVVEAFEHVLGMERVSVNDNFFDLGGDSIKAIHILNKIREAGYDSSMRNLLMERTPKLIAMNLSAKQELIPAEQGEISGEIPLTPIQNYFFAQNMMYPEHFNVCQVFKVREKLNALALEKVLSALVQHHDMLRATYKDKKQVIGKADDKKWYGFTKIECESKEVKEKIKTTKVKMDLEEGPLLQVVLFCTPEQDYMLLVAHHMIMDVISWRILSEDLEKGYCQALDQKEITLPAKTVSFKVWSEGLAHYSQSEKLKRRVAYWSEIENKLVDGKLKEDGVDGGFQPKTAVACLNATITEKLLKESAHAYNTEINDLLLTALGRAVYRVTGQKILALQMEGHGREETVGSFDLGRTIGWFTSIYPVVLEELGTDIAQDIRNTKETLRRVPAHGIDYGIIKNADMVNSEEMDVEAAPDISFNYLGELGTKKESDNPYFQFSQLGYGQDTDPHNQFGPSINVIGHVQEGSLSMTVTCKTSRYSAERIEQIGKAYEEELIAVAGHCSHAQKSESTASDFGERVWTDSEFCYVQEAVKIHGGEIQRIYPLTPMQEGMLYEKLLDESSTKYVVQQTMRLAEVDVEKMHKAFEYLATQHDILRTKICYRGVSVPRQVLLKERIPEFNYMEVDNESAYLDLKEQDVKRGFELEEDTLIRMNLVKINNSGYRLIMTNHHIILDGWCLPILRKELFSAYMATDDERLRVSAKAASNKIGRYEKFVHYINEKDKEISLKYWEDLLQGYETRADILPIGRPEETEEESQSQEFKLSLEVTEQAEAICAQYDVTLNTLVEACWGVLLEKYNLTDDVVYGKVVSGRNAEIEGIEEIVGLFINTIPVRISTTKEDTFADLLKSLQSQAIAANEHDFLSLAEIQNRTVLGRDLIGTLFFFEGYQGTSINIDGNLNVESEYYREQIGYDLGMTAFKSDSLHFRILFSTKVYNKEEINIIGSHLQRLMEQAIAAPQTKLNELDMTNEAEEKKELVQFNATDSDYPRDKTIVQLFEEQVARTPDNTAVVCGDEKLSYAELNARANKLALKLRREYHIQPDDFVAIIAERSLEMVVGLYAILKSGAAYVPIDPFYPEERIKYILEDSQPKAVLIGHGEYDISPEKVVDLYSTRDYEEGAENPEHVNTPHDLIYLVYTSGTTGKPKGVMVEHQHIVNQQIWTQREYPLHEGESLLMKTTCVFDVFAWEVFWWMLEGGKLVILQQGEESQSDKIIKIIQDYKVNAIQFVPSMFNMFLEELDTSKEKINTLRYIINIGEKLNAESVRHYNQLREKGQVRAELLNLYGPAETTVNSSGYHCPTDLNVDKILIGKPISNTQIYILSNEKIAGIGVAGELCIAGESVSRGYLNREELTAQKFIKNPFGSGMMYKTGDLARWLPDGNIEYLGRIDDQVKIRGFRIEPGEIESTLLKLEGVSGAAVVVRQDKQGEKYLCAYVVVRTEVEELDEDKIKSQLRKKLPDYMVPLYIIPIDRIPLSHNGKLNKGALPEPEYKLKEYVAPANREEKLVVEAFEKILGITEISVNDSFFDLGGHSLKATLLCNELGKTIGIKLQLSEIFALATPKRIGEKIRSLQPDSFSEIPKIAKAEFYPMSSVQKRLYLLNEMVGPSISYNISNVIKYENTLDKDQLQGALDKLLEREEILRTSFHLMNGEPVQMIQPDGRVILDYKEADTVDIQAEYDNFVCPFDLSKAPLMRVKLLQTPKASYLMLDIHHIIFDGESLPIMMNRISELYEGHTLPMPRVQYKDFSAWQITQDITKQAAYWKNEFSGEIPILNLNTDFPRPKKMSFKGADVQTKIEEPVCMEIKELAKNYGATEFMIMLSTFMLLLSKYSQQEEIIVGTPVSGRTHVDTQEMLGMFVNSLAIKGKVKQEESFEQVLLGVKEKCLRAYDNQEFQYEDLVEAVDVKRDLSRNPLFDVMFMMSESEIMSGLKSIMSGTWVPMEGKVAKFDLNLMIIHTSEGYVVNLEYCTDLFKQETIKQMVDDYVSLLSEVVKHPEDSLQKLLKKEDVKKEEIDSTQAELNNRANHLAQEVSDLMQALYQRDQAYWKRKVENFPLAPQLPFLSDGKVVNNAAVKRLETKISGKDWTIVKDKALDKKIAPSVVLCTIYAEVLCKWSNQSNMALNLNLSSSQPFHQDGMRLMGDFVSKLLLDIDLSSSREFWERASKIQNGLFEALDHRFYSGVDFIHDLAENRGQEDQAVMPIIFTTMLRDEADSFNTNMGSREEFKYGISQTSQEFLALQVMDKDGELLMAWDYVEDLFDEDMISAMFETYQLRLQQVIENNPASVPLPLKQSKLLLDYNHTQGDYEGDLLQKLIDRQCRKTPDAIAVKLGQDTLTYGELARKSNQIARYLAEQNYPHNSYIGVWAERRIETIVNTVAILKAGHAYIPVNPEHPQERIEYIVEHSDIKLMLHPDIYEKENLSSYNDGTLESLENCRQDKAYAIYTSGSTGHPKGVVITHEAVVNTLLDINEKFKVGREDKIIALSSMCFDLSVYDIFGAFISGAQLVLIPDLLDMDSIHQIMLEEEITIWNSVPAIMDMYMESTNQDTVQRSSTESLRVVMLSGDWIPLGLPEKIKTRMPKAQVISLGGATEGSIWSIYFPIKEVRQEWKSIPYGYPLKNQQIYVLDEFGEECPVGVPGELHIGGKGVAAGYLGEEEKTRASFIKHRLGYLYKTGDYGVMGPEGYIEFLGRRDSQVKIRGHRIELGEIEHCINHLPKIRQSVVADYCDQQGEKHLCGYIVADEMVELAEIQRELAKYLPDYMVPAQLVQVDEIPLSANGKVDRKLLPDPEKYFEESKMTRGYEAPKTQTENLVTEAFAQVLGVNRVGITDSFFDLGGYSLNVIQLCNELEKSTGVRLPLREIFDLVTPKNIAERIKNSKVSAFEEIPKIAEAESYSISSAQKRLYLLDQLTGPGTTYNIPVVIKLKVKPDDERLQRALDQLSEREEILRTSFHMVDGEPIQKIASSARIVLEHSKVNTADSQYIQDEYNDFVQPFDLSKAPLMRAQMLDTPNGSYLFLDIHHILCDAGSMPIMLYEIQELYEERKLLTPRVQYKDFCVWQNARNITEQAAYWKKEFSGDIPILDLMTDYPRPQKQSFRGANFRTQAEEKISIQVKELAKKYGATEFMVLLSTFMSLLGKYSRQEEIIVGTPISGRTHTDTQNMLGMFVNTLAIKGNVCSDDTFENVLSGIKEKCLQAYDNQEYQFEDLVEEVGVKRDFSRNPVFDVMFVLQDNERESYSDSIQFGTRESVEGNISKFDLTLTMISDSEGYKIDFEYSTDLFKPETIQYMAKHFVTLLEEVVMSPEKKMQDIPLTDTDEEEKILGEFNMTDAEYPHNKTIVQLFEEQAARVPDNIAITFKGQQLTYAQLNERANALARKLRKEYDIQPNDFVVILTEKSLEMMVGIYAILKAGAAYVPVDPSYPEERINYIINDCKPKVVLCGAKEPEIYIPILYLHDEANYEMECSNLTHVNQPGDLMYIIYTSGTTGWPKGVMIQHVNVVRLFKNDKFKLDLYENDIWVQFHSYCFDVSVWEIFGSLLNGAKLVIPSEDTVKDAYAFGELLQKEAVTILCQVPSPFYALIDATTGQTINSLRYVILAGEALYPTRLKKWHENNRHCRLVNMYGPTETTVYATYRDIDTEAIERGISDIGKPLPTLKIYMLNGNALCGIGVPGELCITGDGVSQGYLNRQTLTDEKFVDNPLGTGKMYRTGDLARWLPDGNIEYIGRMDDQAKIRGYRIEPGEIESRLLELEGISEAVVVVREDKVQEKYLCAYIIAETEIEEKDVKIHLRKVLPDYMVPAHIIPIDAIPLTRNGKLDRASLPLPEYKSKEYVTPRNENEMLVVQAFEQILGVEDISITDSFFEMGGSSLKAVLLCNELEKATGVRLSLSDIFAFGTPEQIAEKMGSTEVSTFVAIAQVSAAEYYPASAAQKRLYLLDEVTGPNINYNISDVYAYEEPLDKERLQKALDKLLEHEEILRTSFQVVDSEPVQTISPDARVLLDYIEVDTLDIQTEYDKFVQPFNLSEAPLMRVKLVKTTNGSYLFVDIHHIICDGESLPVILHQVNEFYENDGTDRH
ncbi:non-ribosomal peptide synthase protein (TIGR01720 family)/amino acid adenylation domain-containing protein [Mobilisporobacter senegalensis]|uniref:Non-ribosomal peptide synthase protein (TIGR01720 family)/amino acid adenylation domain-containing protein n=1 Tax=Mobilisporobacter senegalensis TaxID=1329262 RepID=A0A3N1XGQ7_9FIRM|nr:non-ribosomal peptide synthetase [Mobilisporobacter senegalensis]ROR25864.1 non-ribosomal peptide synthase protein (TIGR01720 family)/amino acid adenylation domain-containing protein [Mobilisporobacter senegalensis]